MNPLKGMTQQGLLPEGKKNIKGEREREKLKMEDTNRKPHCNKKNINLILNGKTAVFQMTAKIDKASSAQPLKLY